MSDQWDRVTRLEEATIDVLIEYLLAKKPPKELTQRSRIAVNAFSSIQRRKSAENQRDALQYMMVRDGIRGPRELPSGSVTTATSPSKNGPEV